jgi:RNA polymerase sigma-70 factor (ECF subfamily)
MQRARGIASASQAPDTARQRHLGPVLPARRPETPGAGLSDPFAFEVAVRRHSETLQAIIWSFVRDNDEAEELLQETWARVYLRRAQYAGQGSLSQWIRAICCNICLSHVRRRSTLRSKLALIDGSHLVSDPPRAPDEHAEVQAQLTRVCAALAELPEGQRRTVELRIIQDRSVREAATALGCPHHWLGPARS